MPRRERTLFLIDGSAQLHRAYFAIRNLSTTRGLPTGATYGFTTMLRKLYQDEDPEWCGISFDLAGPTFRHEEYTEYKAQRRKMDDDLRVQLPFVRRVCGVFGLPIVDSPGFEADDVIATLARQAVEAGLKVVVVSGDKDLLQMVDGNVLVLNPGREGAGSILYDRATVEEKFGVPPERVVDVLALVGDAVDNVPGVPGIGEKGARDLVRAYGPVEQVLENADQVKKATYREGLRQHAQAALLSKRLVTLRTDVPVALDLDALRREPADRNAAHALFTELEFVALAREYAPEPATIGTRREVIRDEAALAAFAARARQRGVLALSLVRSSREPMRARLAGMGLAVEPGEAVYVPAAGAHLDATDALPAARVLEVLRPVLEDERVAKLSPRGKLDHILLARAGVRLRGLVFDALVAAYLLHPGRRTTAVEDLALEHLGQRPRPTGNLLEGGAEGATLEAAADAAAQEADLTLRLHQPIARRLEEEGVAEVYARTELPLVEVLAEMERAGVKVNPAYLREMSAEMEQQLEQLTREIYVLAGGEFNIQSPIQLREVLFTRLGLKARSAKKTAKTRVASTAEEVLEELADAGHELPRKILEYRGVQKLKSTYVDPLPTLVNPDTGRVHASFQQTIAATGRLSVTEPNLQNVPIRTPTGRRVREAFVAEAGHLLLSADYSQIELRVLAHLSRDATLIDTFRRGEDVHDRTGREIFGPFSPVPRDEQRRVSKMVNYALLYGKSAFTLAKDIGVTREQAEQFIQAYFSRYPSVKQFLDDTVERARETGVVRTLLGRLRRLPDLRSPNYQMRAEAERQALNMPVQGSAADLIKKA
ncbi:MAG TPA: DNA polymerase I, partial [Vicinamibacteria bacterium]|nr:DNA polymerase I [Vicinamibacteria bacterium]